MMPAIFILLSSFLILSRQFTRDRYWNVEWSVSVRPDYLCVRSHDVTRCKVFHLAWSTRQTDRNTIILPLSDRTLSSTNSILASRLTVYRVFLSFLLRFSPPPARAVQFLPVERASNRPPPTEHGHRPKIGRLPAPAFHDDPREKSKEHQPRDFSRAK